jgi:hypothetical protein
MRKSLLGPDKSRQVEYRCQEVGSTTLEHMRRVWQPLTERRLSGLTYGFFGGSQAKFAMHPA